MSQRRGCDGKANLTQEFVMESLRHEQVRKIGPVVRARTGLERHGIKTLISMNDEGRTFPQIAGWIGRNLQAKEPCDEQVQGNVRKWAVAHHPLPRENLMNALAFHEWAGRRGWNAKPAPMIKFSMAAATKETDNEHSQARTSRLSEDRLFRRSKGHAFRLLPFPL